MKARHEFESDNDYLEYLRTYFAAMAMQGWISSWGVSHTDDAIDISTRSTACADALIKALNETK